MNKECIPFGDAMGMEVAFSNAIAVKNTDIKKTIWLAGQIAYNEKGVLVGKNNIKIQTEQCIENLKLILDEFDATLDNIVEVTVFVKDTASLKDIHDVRLRYFNRPYPSSSLLHINGFVHPDALIEIKAIATI